MLIALSDGSSGQGDAIRVGRFLTYFSTKYSGHLLYSLQKYVGMAFH
jgi:hypothetical protein